ncbi:hypothetical protein M422DRAFT_262691 [Sphaerobolus stellatus SS14]|uniref:WSC domain-containing protein n=1 Tax=Sphaerobolus stellatus (strain SS14) TaxID=990650 RepID=A0A0C9V0H2_SPHS4|nr:hypothetical protein M422DRAFT_262691 [Sphaerobolus stellatus SS14]
MAEVSAESLVLRPRDFIGSAGNRSTLPAEWSPNPSCQGVCDSGSPLNSLLLGPSTIQPTTMTIEFCVSVCDMQGYSMAGLFGAECQCSNVFNPLRPCFDPQPIGCQFRQDSIDMEFGSGQPCPGNVLESCGNSLPDASPALLNIFFKGQCSILWRGGAKLTSGSWRLIGFYNDTVGARALPHNAVDLHPGLPRGNLTLESCVAACSASGFSLAGLEFADECYCGDILENESQPLIPVSNCTIPPNAGAMRCKGDPSNFCGGPNLLYLYSLNGTGLTSLIPYGSLFDGFCDDCVEFGVYI